MRKKGFTLLELLLVISLIGVVSVVAIPAYTSFQTRNNIDICATTFAQGARRAETLASNQEQDSRWGIKIILGKIIIFKGDSYDARDTTVDEEYDIATNIDFSGQDEFVFNKYTGFPISVGTLNLTGANNESKSVSINEKGIVNY